VNPSDNGQRFIIQNTPFYYMPAKKVMGRNRAGQKLKKMFQTVDVGTREGDHVMGQAQKFKHREYGAVDPRYKESGKFGLMGTVLEKTGVTVHRGTLAEFITKMRQEGWKTNHFNIDMPNRGFYKKADISHLFGYAEHLLRPNGKIFITTESPADFRNYAQLAKAYGLKVRVLKKWHGTTEPKGARRTKHMRDAIADQGIYRLEITLGMKKAIPDKSKRRLAQN
jgi:hypothetical protein